MTEFTPGPWTMDYKPYNGWTFKGGYLGQINAVNGTQVYAGPASFHSLRGETPEIAFANARLIAEAPAMYEALGKIFHQKMKSGNTGFWVSGTNMQEVRAILERIDNE